MTLSDNVKTKLKLVSARPHRRPSVPWSCWRYTCPPKGVLNLVATGSETAGLIRRRRGRAPIGCGLCSCQSARTLPPPASDQSVILRRRHWPSVRHRETGGRGGEPSVDPDGSVGRPSATDRFYYCRSVQLSLKMRLQSPKHDRLYISVQHSCRARLRFFIKIVNALYKLLTFP